MSRQPYIYTMPESFLKDNNVPARWRVLGVINGFIINGGCFYGSNEWLMEQLGCSQQTISSAFSELEALGEIRTERTKRTRKVYKTSRDTSKLVSDIQTDSSRDPSQLVPNSVSNSVREEGASEDGTRAAKVYEPEEGTSTKSTRLAKGEQEKLQPLVRWAERERGFPFLSTEQGKQLKALSLAKQNGIKAAELRERWEEMSSDKFWSEKGYDWMNVVKSFNTKRA